MIRKKMPGKGVQLIFEEKTNRGEREKITATRNDCFLSLVNSFVAK
jgi:hypothetical protein